MKIEEIIRTCADERLADAAVSSIGRSFAVEMRVAADRYGMSLGGFTAFAVNRFARLGDEREMRAVLNAMSDAQEPLLAGLRHILCTTLASSVSEEARPSRDPIANLPAAICTTKAHCHRRPY